MQYTEAECRVCGYAARATYSHSTDWDDIYSVHCGACGHTENVANVGE